MRILACLVLSFPARVDRDAPPDASTDKERAARPIVNQDRLYVSVEGVGTATLTVRDTDNAGNASADSIEVHRLPARPSVVRNLLVTAPYRWRSDPEIACTAIEEGVDVLGFETTGPAVGNANSGVTWRWGCIEWEHASSVAEAYVMDRREEGSSLVVAVGGSISGSSRRHTDSTHQGSTPWYYGVAPVVDRVESEITWATYPTVPASDVLDLVVSVPVVRDLGDPDTTSSGVGLSTTTIRWTFSDPWSTATGITSTFSLAHYYEALYDSFNDTIASASRSGLVGGLSSRDTRDFAHTTNFVGTNSFHWHTSVASDASRDAGSLNEIAGIALSEVMRFTVDEDLTDSSIRAMRDSSGDLRLLGDARNRSVAVPRTPFLVCGTA